MIKTPMYVYLGTNGTLTTPIHLEDIYYVSKMRLEAEPGKYLTNDGGKTKVKEVLIPLDDVSSWKEISVVKAKSK